MVNSPTIYFIDGTGYVFRAYYAIRPLSTSDGTPTNAVLGFARMLGRLLNDEKPGHIAIAFDTPEKTFRHEFYPEYKANRQSPPEDLIPQFALVHEFVEAMGISVQSQPGFEADDVIATLSRKAVAAGHRVVVVSADKDLMQLVSPQVGLIDPMKGRRIDRDAVVEKFGVAPERVVDVQALAGDSSDNIPGVPKVGVKTAAKLVSTFGDLEQIIKGVQRLPKPKAAERSVTEHVEQARLSKRLATLAVDAPVVFALKQLEFQSPNPTRLADFLRRIEAFTLLRDFGLSGGSVSEKPTGQLAGEAAPIDRSSYRTLLSLEEIQEEATHARRAGLLSVDLETTSLDPNRAEIVGIALCAADRSACYVPVGHRYLGAPTQPKLGDVLAILKPLLTDESLAKVGQNLKYDQIVLARVDVPMSGIEHDTMLSAWVLDPARPSYSLDSLAREILGHETIRYRDVTGSGKNQIGFDEVPVETATEYAAEDADVALKLRQSLHPQVEEAGLQGLLRELELPLLPVLAAMERRGILVDVKQLKELGREFSTRLNDIEQRATELAGKSINLASPKQLSKLFFEDLGYPVVKKTKTGYSTDQEVLETLARDFELPGVVLEHRLLAKLKSTYVDALPRMVNEITGRVHTSFNQTGTATGRLSSSDPNLQNIPIRTEDGRRIRKAFIAPEGWELISADYSQIELRVMAHLSEDPSFVEAFHRGDDIHKQTAREILTGGGTPSPEQRRQAKAINFGILYGLSAFGLSRQLNISKGEADHFIQSYFARYPTIRAFVDRTIDTARDIGFVTTIAGRRRFLPDLKSRNHNIRQAAERIAVNTAIQGSAADMIKIAMVRLSATIKERRLRAQLLLQVHDELILEAPVAERDEVMKIVGQQMSNVMSLCVPLVVEMGHAPNWAAAH